MVGETKRKFRVGDEFDIPVVVLETEGQMLSKPYKVQVRGRPDLTDWVCGASLEASKLTKAVPEPLKVGDRVVAASWPSPTTKVLWVEHPYCLVKFFDQPEIHHVDNLKRAADVCR